MEFQYIKIKIFPVNIIIYNYLFKKCYYRYCRTKALYLLLFRPLWARIQKNKSCWLTMDGGGGLHGWRMCPSEISLFMSLWLTGNISVKDVELQAGVGWSAPGRQCCCWCVRLWGSSTRPSAPWGTRFLDPVRGPTAARPDTTEVQLDSQLGLSRLSKLMSALLWSGMNICSY